MRQNTYLIVNKKASEFNRAIYLEKSLEFLDGSGNEVGHLSINDSIYTVLYCDEVNNITFVVDRGNAQDVVTLLWQNNSEYLNFREQLSKKYGLELSKQNIKINRYAESIAEKLANGVKLRVTDAADNSDMVECPECGMMNTKGSPYCMECGADL